MNLATGQPLRLVSEGRTFEARVLLVGDAHDLVLDVAGHGVQRFKRVGRRWQATGIREWSHGGVEVVVVEGDRREAAPIGGGARTSRRRRG